MCIRDSPDGYRHAIFGNYLMRYRMVTHVVGHVEHYAGDQMYIDFAGDKLEALCYSNPVANTRVLVVLTWGCW